FPEESDQSMDVGDPTWLKCKSTLWGQAGRWQSQLGSWTGLTSLEERGHAWEEWASITSKQARRLSQEGVPSRLHDDYDRVVSFMSRALGHVSGQREF
ncbi:hypothetical protein DM01DRAFT_248335, partial [Hesseltinella vesiculosa]